MIRLVSCVMIGDERATPSGMWKLRKCKEFRQLGKINSALKGKSLFKWASGARKNNRKSRVATRQRINGEECLVGWKKKLHRKWIIAANDCRELLGPARCRLRVHNFSIRFACAPRSREECKLRKRNGRAEEKKLNLRLKNLAYLRA